MHTNCGVEPEMRNISERRAQQLAVFPVARIQHRIADDGVLKMPMYTKACLSVCMVRLNMLIMQSLCAKQHGLHQPMLKKVSFRDRAMVRS